MNEENARKWMKVHVSDYVDTCGEVNATGLAEDCCDNFDCNDVDGPLDDPDHWVWDLAVEVADMWEKVGQ